MEKKGFERIYPFTTEDISGYINLFNINGKDIFTVGSSGDQVFNSIMLGAKSVTLFDINNSAKEFFNAKKNIIMSTPREKLYEEVLNQDFHFSEDIFTKKSLEKMNLYMKNDKNYNTLKEKLKKAKIDFITGDIFELDKTIISKKYDLILLSNVIQYLKEDNYKSIDEKLFDIYIQLKKILNDEGIIQFMYLYGSILPNEFTKIIKRFLKNDILLEKVKCNDSVDSIILVK